MTALERDDAQVLFFRISCDLGFALEKHRDDLSNVLAGREENPLFVHLKERSKQWVDSHWEKLAKLAYDGHIKVVRSQIHADTTESDPELARVYNNIARDLSATDVGALSAIVHRMCRQSHQRTSDALASHGGEAASRRWPQCREAVIAFDWNEPGPTRCSFSRGKPDLITIHIGDQTESDCDPQKGALRTYFNLEFFLFHEYLSHSYPLWDSRDSLFSEGYLVAAAKAIFYTDFRDPVRIGFLEDTFDARPPSAERRAETAARWLHANFQHRFLRYLLEWASLPGSDENNDRVRRLMYLPDWIGANAERFARVRRAFEAGWIDGIHAAIREMEPPPPAGPRKIRLP